VLFMHLTRRRGTEQVERRVVFLVVWALDMSVVRIRELDLGVSKDAL